MGKKQEGMRTVTSSCFTNIGVYSVRPLLQCYEKEGVRVTAQDSPLIPSLAHKTLNERPFTPERFKGRNYFDADTLRGFMLSGVKKKIDIYFTAEHLR